MGGHGQHGPRPVASENSVLFSQRKERDETFSTRDSGGRAMASEYGRDIEISESQTPERLVDSFILQLVQGGSKYQREKPFGKLSGRAYGVTSEQEPHRSGELDRMIGMSIAV